MPVTLPSIARLYGGPMDGASITVAALDKLFRFPRWSDVLLRPPTKVVSINDVMIGCYGYECVKREGGVGTYRYVGILES